jgi:hypothetical protein
MYGGLLVERTDSSLIIVNCTIWGNSAHTAGPAGRNAAGIACAFGASATATNSVIGENAAPGGPQIFLHGSLSVFNVTYSNVVGGQTAALVKAGSTLNWGDGNIDADPLFARYGYWDDKGTREASDDVWVEDDFHLKSQAGRWHPDSQTWIQDDVTSPCIDAGDPDSDWKAELWPHGMLANMGAYGGTLQASRSLSEAGNMADVNRDGIVDSTDMCMMVDHWHTYEPYCDIAPTPFGDGVVDVEDLIVLAEHLFEEVP